MKFFNKNTVSAKMADYTLTVHVQSDAASKIVYTDLSEMTGAEIYLKEKDKSFVLAIKDSEQHEREIYTFDNRNDALRAMKAVAGAMLSSKGLYKGKGGFRRLVGTTFKVVVILFVILVALNFFSSPAPQQIAMPEGAQPQAPIASEQPQALQQDKMPEGKPVPLDETVK